MPQESLKDWVNQFELAIDHVTKLFLYHHPPGQYGYHYTVIKVVFTKEDYTVYWDYAWGNRYQTGKTTFPIRFVYMSPEEIEHENQNNGRPQ